MRYAPQISMMSLALCLVAFTICACAKRDDGSYDINLGTITESLRTGKLVVNEEEELSTPSHPEKPRSGCILIVGELESDGRYDCKNPQKALTEFNLPGMRGMDFYDDGSFSAEIDKQTGEVASAKMYFLGHVSGALDQEGELDKKLNGSFGKASSNNYVISVSGPAFEVWDTRRNGKIRDQSAVIMGKGDLLTAPEGTVFKGRFYIGVDSVPIKTPSKSDCDANITFGTATFKVIR